MNYLLVFVVVCGITLSTYAAPQESQQTDSKERYRRRVPSSSYTRTEEGVAVVIPGLGNTTDSSDNSTTISPSEEDVTVPENNNVTTGLTAASKPAPTPSSQGGSDVKLATTPGVPQDSSEKTSTEDSKEKTSTVPSETNDHQSTETPPKKEQGFLSNKGPFGLPIPKPFPTGGLKIETKLPSIPNIFGR